MKIVAIADSDSYVKWGAALVATLPEGWTREILVVTTPLAVSDGQLATALGDSRVDGVRRVEYRDLRTTLDELRPDAVLVAALGPLAMVLIRVVAALVPRPVVISGMPGITIPTSSKALRYRRQADLLVVHSHTEASGFREMIRERGTHLRVGLASLPFAVSRPAHGTDLVFATQSIVPRPHEDRMRIALALRDAALADPTRRVVIKTRAAKGEQQTHVEDHDIADLVRELGPMPANLVVSTAPMDEALDTAEGLVTVSSTAIIEAVSRGIPVIAIDDFGVSRRLINQVLEGSGLFGDLDAVVRREFRHPEPSWLDANYLHDPADNDWIAQLGSLIDARAAGTLPDRAAAVPLGGRLREAWDRKLALGAYDRSALGTVALVIGVPARGVVRASRRVRARLRHRHAETGVVAP